MTDFWSPAQQPPGAIPFRNKFDNARDPLTARNAIGAVGLNSPVFTGDPQAPTPPPGDDDQSLATTEWVNDAITAAVAGAGSGFASSADFPATAWTAWSPTITSSSGTLTSTTVNRARYIKLGKTVIANVDVTITNAGTGAGNMQFSLPVAASASGGGLVSGQETVMAGYLVGGCMGPSATTAPWTSYNGGSPIATNFRFNVTAIYEAA